MSKRTYIQSLVILVIISIAILFTVIQNHEAFARGGGGGHYCIIAPNGTILKCVGPKHLETTGGIAPNGSNGTQAYHYFGESPNNVIPTDLVYVTSTHSVYNPGQSVIIYGIVINHEENPSSEILTLSISDSNHNTIVNQQIKPSSTGVFADALVAGGSPLKGTGYYIVTVNYANMSNSTVFFVEN